MNDDKHVYISPDIAAPHNDDRSVVNDPVGPALLEVDIAPESERHAKVEKFVALVQGGMTPKGAAKKVGESLAGLASIDREIYAKVEKLVRNNLLARGVREKMVEAALNKILVDNVDSCDAKAQKLALEAAKIIGQQTGSVPPDTSVTLSLEMSELIKGAQLPGLEDQK